MDNGKPTMINPMEMSSAELFDNFHLRMRVRNKISNALTALAIHEAKIQSKNLRKYVSDGSSLIQEFIDALECITRDGPISCSYHHYSGKVLVDILTSRLRQEIDSTEVGKYHDSFKVVLGVFKTLEMNEEPDAGNTKTSKNLLIELDKEIESTYEEEDRLYFGSNSRNIGQI